MGHTDDLQQPTMMVFFLRVTADEQQQCSAGICSSGSPARQHQPCSGAGGGGEAPPKLPLGIWASFVGCYPGNGCERAVCGGPEMAFCAVPSAVNSSAAAPSF